MPRSKGSENKKAFEQVETIEVVDERIAAAEASIASLAEELKTKKAEMKRYQKMRSGSPPRRRRKQTKQPSWLPWKAAERAWKRFWSC